MLKLSKDKTKLKRRIPFKIENINIEEFDNNLIYVENFPIELRHEDLAIIFIRSG